MRALTERAQLAAEMEAVGARIAGAIEGLTEEHASKQSIDGWSVRDHLSHMCVWHEMRTMEIMRISRGGMAAMPEVNDEQLEAINRTFAELRRRLPLTQIVADLNFVRGLVREAIQNCPEDALNESKYEELGITGTGHDMEHVETIEAWRKREGI